MVVACWVVSVLAGGAAVAVTAAHRAGRTLPPTTGLAPSTLAHYLTAAAGPDAHDLRINGIYGSGSSGAWQFVAHLSWLDSTGTLESATTDFPQQTGTTTPDPSLSGAQLADEQRIGWTIEELQDAIRNDNGLDNAPLASLELQTTDSESDITTCISKDAVASETGAPAACVTRTLDGASRPFSDVLTVSPGGGPLSVQRNGHRITE